MRRIPLSRRSHITGFRPVDGEAVEHESALERDFVLLVNFLDVGAAITSQPITIEFEDGVLEIAQRDVEFGKSRFHVYQLAGLAMAMRRNSAQWCADVLSDTRRRSTDVRASPPTAAIRS